MDGNHDVNVNVNINLDSDKVAHIIWTLCFASIARNWFRIRK